MDLSQEIALVTGASRGIGAAIADTLAGHGAFVIGTATTEEGARGITGRLGGRGAGEVVNVAETHSVSALFNRLKQASRLPSVVVNNAGITRDGLLARMSDDDWDAVLSTNLASLYRVCKAAARHLMKRRGGRIINIGSVVGCSGNAGQSNYAAAKAGLVGFTRALARELGGRRITVNAVAPGFIDTDMTRGLQDAQRQQLVGQIPLGRLGEPAEVAAAVLFLASPMAAYITGHTLHVNGGMYMG